MNEFGTKTGNGQITPLEWYAQMQNKMRKFFSLRYAGFQALLLTLPDDKWMKTVNWISLFDHNKQVRTSFEGYHS